MSTEDMSIEDGAPVVLPVEKALRAPSNGVPSDELDYEDTGQVFRAVLASSSQSLVEAFINKATKHLESNGNGGDGDAPAKHAKSVKRHNWITIVLVALLGPGGVYATMQVVSAQSKVNSYKVEHLEKASKALEPRVEAAEKAIVRIDGHLGTIDKSIEGINTSTGETLKGIKELKQENLDELKQELEEAKAEIRRRDRQDRNR